MKKFLLVIAIAIVIVSGFFGYKYYFNLGDYDAWSFIPQDAIIVYEADDPVSVWQDIKDQKVWQTIESMSGVGQLKSKVEELDTLSGSGVLSKLLNNNKLLIGIAPVSKSEFDFLYVFQIKNIDQHSAISNILKNNYRVKVRHYAGFKISDITNTSDNSKFSYIFYKNFFIGSGTAFLVEDAIRTISDPSFTNFQTNQPALFQLAKLQNDAGNLYINSSKINDLAKIIISDLAKTNLDLTTSSTFLDARIDTDHLLLNGFSLNKAENNFLKVFDNNLGATLEQLDYIPNDAAFVSHISFQDERLFLSSIKKWIETQEKDLWKLRAGYQSKYDLEFESFTSWLGHEACVYTLESNNENFDHRVAIIETKSVADANAQLRNISDRVANASNDSTFFEKYGSYDIVHLPLNEFVASFLGPIFRGFENSFYTSINDQIIFSNDLQTIKDLTDQIENENIWSKSLKMNNYFNIANKESNLSFFLNTKRSWETVTANLSPTWAKVFEENSNEFKSFELIGLQFSNVDNKYFTNLTIYQPEDFEPTIKGKNLKPKYALSLASPIISKPTVVKNHNTGAFELFVQDSSKNIYLMSDQFEVIWSDTLEDAIQSNIYQVDYFKNGKLQYLFATGNDLHLLDRNGDYVEGFPKPVGLSPIRSLNVIDYNNTKDYRWSVTSKLDQLYLLGKNGDPLKGWGPHSLLYEGKHPIKHLRVRGKDIFVLIEERGIVNILSRRGKSYKGFPIRFDKKIDENYIITSGGTFAQSLFTMVTKDGELIQINLQGQLKSREQLIKDTKESTFSILKDKNSTRFLILRQDENKIAILEKDGTVRFEKNYLSDTPVQAQYYDFGTGNELIIIIDPQQEYGYLYNGQGDLINNLPIEVNQPLSVLFYESEGLFKIFKVHQNEVSYYEIKK